MELIDKAETIEEDVKHIESIQEETHQAASDLDWLKSKVTKTQV